MSVRVSKLVWRHSASKGSARLVLLAIAGYANDEGTGAWPSLETLASDTQLTVRAVQYALARLVALGELQVRQKAGPGWCNLYTILIEGWCKDFTTGGAKISPGGANDDMGVVKLASPDPSYRSVNEEDDLRRDEISVKPREERDGERALPPSPQPAQSQVTPTPAGAAAPLRSVSKAYSARTPAKRTTASTRTSQQITPAPLPTRLPSDFALTEARRLLVEDMARLRGVRIDVELVFRKFKGHFTRGAGREVEQEDWDWRWERWVIDDIERAQAAGPVGAPAGRGGQGHEQRGEQNGALRQTERERRILASRDEVAAEIERAFGGGGRGRRGGEAAGDHQGIPARQLDGPATRAGPGGGG